MKTRSSISKIFQAGACTIKLFTATMEQHVLDTNAGKQLPKAATDV
jgi:hypothetical protein